MEWVKCSERLPEENATVLLYAYVGYPHGYEREKKIYSAYWSKSFGRNGWYTDCDCSGYERDAEYLDPISWMPLPAQPKEK